MLLGATPLGPRALVFGTAPSPPDTTAASTDIGGITAAWTRCLEGNVALFRLSIFTVETLVDRVLVVKRSYPATNPDWNAPIMTRCDPPQYSAARVSGGCYVLNPSGAPLDCTAPQAVAVLESTWSRMKELYR
jgi:hypothetical protein